MNKEKLKGGCFPNIPPNTHPNTHPTPISKKMRSMIQGCSS